MTGGADCSVTGSAEYFVTGGAECFVPGGTECFVLGGTECLVGSDLAVQSAYCHPNLPLCVPLYSCKWGSAVPMSISLQLV